MESKCTISFYKNDLQRAKSRQGKCPVNNCGAQLERAPFQKYKGTMRYLPFCPEHGLRIHPHGFVYYNGPSKGDLITATRRNLPFHGDYYVTNFFKKGNKMESGRLCYENSEDAVSYNVFTELLANGQALRKLVEHITKRKIDDAVYLYLWGGKIDLKNQTFTQCQPLLEARKHLEFDIKRFATEPDIMLVVPKRLVICIEAKFASKNPIAKEKDSIEGEKPKRKEELITRYCQRNTMIDCHELFDFSRASRLVLDNLHKGREVPQNLIKAAARDIEELKRLIEGLQ